MPYRICKARQVSNKNAEKRIVEMLFFFHKKFSSIFQCSTKYAQEHNNNPKFHLPVHA